ncbi:hypothetical protein [Aureliella helgolandensis]|uniref:Uncharacterized protein n=1 Tax=Aureliella helgolandensis TaxID=2527968 RepID=A0A518G5H1_9BACT|nr:hypothetical protein [Aureliella helgolandensis]QDV23836.1 hypothetical protein Q31a_21420 [Aureliella helgolandensis]
MHDNAPFLLARFAASDNQGNEYLISHYVIYSDAVMSDKPISKAPREYFLTGDQRLVRWVAKGHFETCDTSQTQLFTDDYQSPDRPA